jgi:hypothetical protein
VIYVLYVSIMNSFEMEISIGLCLIIFLVNQMGTSLLRVVCEYIQIAL